MDEYLRQGNPPPAGCLYLNEFVGADAMGDRDTFLETRTENPLQKIMDRIAATAKHLLEDKYLE
jgi:hypothetical protein